MTPWFRTFWRPTEDEPTAPAPVGAEGSSRWQKAALIVAAGLVSAYLVSVLVHSRKMTDIGLTCIFSTDVLRADPPYLHTAAGAPLHLDLNGYRVEQIGPFPIATWPDYLRALRRFNTDSLSAANGGPTFRTQQGEEQVLVQLRSDTGEPVEVWCRVDRSAAESTLPSVLWFGLKGSLFLVSFFVFWKRPHDRSAAQFFVLSIVTVGAFMGGYHWWRITSSPVLTLVFIVSSVLLPAVNLHFYLLFPQPKRFLKDHPLGALLGIYGVPAGFLIALVVSYFYVRAVVSADGDVQGALLALLELIMAYLAVAGTLYVASVGCLMHSWWTATDTTTRNQVKCILAGSLLALGPIGYSLYLAIFDRDRFGGGAATWPMFAASACFTFAYAVSITRYRLMQLDQLLSSGVVYFLISFLAALVYYAVVFATMLVVGRGAAGPSLGNALIFSLAAVVLAVLLDLARSRLKKALDRRFHKEKKGLDRTLQQMGETLQKLVDPPALARRLLQAASELLGVSRGAVYLREGTPPLYRLAESLGTPPALGELASGCPLIDSLQRAPLLTMRRDPWGVAEGGQGQLRFLGGEIAQALMHEGQLLALLVLGPKDSGPYTTEDHNLLAALAQITALALE
ncbi:MAG: GAF domain-containing protein, partial [Planctomycetia bacterium]|nr:GAF domain-containing protein [Planctomycetia bacterium]